MHLYDDGIYSPVYVHWFQNLISVLMAYKFIEYQNYCELKELGCLKVYSLLWLNQLNM